ncbi:MAG TPA: HAD family hydrolase [Thermoplasmata archaeon]
MSGVEYGPSRRQARVRMKKIAAVTFDLWDTLIQENPGGSARVAGIRAERIGSILSSRGLMHTEDEILAAHEKTGQFLQLVWIKRRDMAVRDQVLFMLSSIDGRLAGKLTEQDLRDVEKAYTESLLDNPPRLLPGAKDALKDVRGKGYRLGLISNTGRTPGSTLRILMDRMGILGDFDVTTFSNEIMIRKPAEGAFKVTLERLRVVPKAAVHIGDDPESDVLGAKRAGMRAIQIVQSGGPMASQADRHADSLAGISELIERL